MPTLWSFVSENIGVFIAIICVAPPLIAGIASGAKEARAKRIRSAEKTETEKELEKIRSLYISRHEFQRREKIANREYWGRYYTSPFIIVLSILLWYICFFERIGPIIDTPVGKAQATFWAIVWCALSWGMLCAASGAIEYLVLRYSNARLKKKSDGDDVLCWIRRDYRLGVGHFDYHIEPLLARMVFKFSAFSAFCLIVLFANVNLVAPTKAPKFISQAQHEAILSKELANRMVSPYESSYPGGEDRRDYDRAVWSPYNYEPYPDTVVYIAPYSGKRYHYIENCEGLESARSIVDITLDDAEDRGLTPCPFCAK